MQYELIVLDLDGTLTNSKKEITPPTREALIEIQKAGKKVVLASGRPGKRTADGSIRRLYFDLQWRKNLSVRHWQTDLQ